MKFGTHQKEKVNEKVESFKVHLTLLVILKNTYNKGVVRDEGIVTNAQVRTIKKGREMQKQMAKMLSEQEEWAKTDYQYYFASIVLKMCGAIEARRNSNFTNYSGYEQDESYFREAYENNVEGTYQDNLASAYIMLMAFCGKLNIDVDKKTDKMANIINDKEIYDIFNIAISLISSVPYSDTFSIIRKTELIEDMAVEALFCIESLSERSGKEIFWHVGNRLAYNSIIKNDGANDE